MLNPREVPSQQRDLLRNICPLGKGVMKYTVHLGHNYRIKSLMEKCRRGVRGQNYTAYHHLLAHKSPCMKSCRQSDDTQNACNPPNTLESSILEEDLSLGQWWKILSFPPGTLCIHQLHPCTCELPKVCYTNSFFVNSRSKVEGILSLKLNFFNSSFIKHYSLKIPPEKHISQTLINNFITVLFTLSLKYITVLFSLLLK